MNVNLCVLFAIVDFYFVPTGLRLTSFLFLPVLLSLTGRISALSTISLKINLCFEQQRLNECEFVCAVCHRGFLFRPYGT
jgi:hypothetical protein